MERDETITIGIEGSGTEELAPVPRRVDGGGPAGRARAGPVRHHRIMIIMIKDDDSSTLK